ncbi:MAG: hypothetical protein U0354_17875 [Candidatus Sericytochromatia bacterium]
MTRRLQIRIMATFVILLLTFVGFFLYNKYINAIDMIPKDAKAVKSVIYAKSNKAAIFEVRWKEDMNSASVKDKNNYMVEHVYPVRGKWLTAVDGKKCNVDFVQHVPDPRDPDKKGKVTQITVKIDPKETIEDFYRLRIRNVSKKDGEKLAKVEYGVVQVSSFANFTKK